MMDLWPGYILHNRAVISLYIISIRPLNKDVSLQVEEVYC